MKPEWLFTADNHFDHDAMLQYRPFSNLKTMNKSLIKSWNKVVRGCDIVVCAGDFAWATQPNYVKETFIEKLNGNKIFIKGNHDFWIRKSETRHIYMKNIDGIKYFICHYPARSWIGDINLHGHCHANLEPLYNQLDIGVDNAYKLLNEFRPFRIEEIKEIIRKNNTRVAEIPKLYEGFRKI